MLSESGTSILDASEAEPLKGSTGTAAGTPGHMIYSNLLESEDYIDVGKVASDGLVHLVQ